MPARASKHAELIRGALRDGSVLTTGEIAVETGLSRDQVVAAIRRHMTLGKELVNTENSREAIFWIMPVSEHIEREASGNWSGTTKG